MISMMEIPFIKNRIEIWLFKKKFQKEIKFILNDIENVLNSIIELKEDKNWFKILSIILTISNFLNSNGPKKDSYGIILNN
jgi:hypothetical protein